MVISIFVNPAQFAPHEDFDAYPRTWDADRQIIQNLGLPIVAVFMPTKQEMYPGTISLNVTEQKGAFVEVLGLSEQVTFPSPCSKTDQISSRVCRDPIFSEVLRQSFQSYSISSNPSVPTLVKKTFSKRLF